MATVAEILKHEITTLFGVTNCGVGAAAVGSEGEEHDYSGIAHPHKELFNGAVKARVLLATLKPGPQHLLYQKMYD